MPTSDPEMDIGLTLGMVHGTAAAMACVQTLRNHPQAVVIGIDITEAGMHLNVTTANVPPDIEALAALLEIAANVIATGKGATVIVHMDHGDHAHG